MPIVGVIAYPTMETVCNLARSIIMDDMAGATNTVGEGQILVDNLAISVTLGNFFNSALRELGRRLRIVGSPTLIRDNFIIQNLPVINGPMGSGVPDPTRQCNLGVTGFFDGLMWWPNIVLPADCLQVEVIWQRQSALQNTFTLMGQPARGLAGLNQGMSLGQWEWRQDGVWFNGAVTPIDIRLRYQGKLLDQYQSGVNLSQTYIPIMDCEEAMAFLIAKLFAMRQGSTTLPGIAQDAETAVNHLILEQSKRNQCTNYEPESFGSETLIL